MAKMPDRVTVKIKVHGAKRAARLLGKAAAAARKYLRAKKKAERAVASMRVDVS